MAFRQLFLWEEKFDLNVIEHQRLARLRRSVREGDFHFGGFRREQNPMEILPRHIVVPLVVAVHAIVDEDEGFVGDLRVLQNDIQPQTPPYHMKETFGSWRGTSFIVVFSLPFEPF